MSQQDGRMDPSPQHSPSADPQVQREFTPGDLQLAGIIEGVLFASDASVTEAALLRVLRKRRDQIRAALAVLAQGYQHPGRGLRLETVAGAYCLTTKPEHYEVLAAFVAERKEATKLSRAAIKTLALIAMRQPMPAEEIKEIRGVNSSGPLQMLLKRGLITRAYGQSDGGKVFRYRPTHYRTTRQFLIEFGLNSPDDFRQAEPFRSYFDEIHRSLAHDAWLRAKKLQSAGASTEAGSPQMDPLDGASTSEDDAKNPAETGNQSHHLSEK